MALDRKKVVGQIAVVAAIFACLASFVFLWRVIDSRRKSEHRIHLFNAASGVLPDFTDSDNARAAIRELGADPSPEAEQLLITLATRTSNIPGLNPGVDAVNELGKRGGERISGFLASLVSTQRTIDERRAAVQALRSLRCSLDCASALLDYLNRIENGELNIEDRNPPDFGADINQWVANKNKADQQQIYDMIDEILLRDVGVTSSALAEEYGLGTANPKSFAVNFAVNSKRQDFCPALIQSEKKNLEGTDLPAVRKELTNAIRALKCDGF